MKPDDFEQRLQRQLMRQVPPEWREEILSVAQQPSRPIHVSRFTFHASLLSTLLWPHPRAWAGLAAVWLVILAVNFSTRGDTQVLAKHLTPPSPEMVLALREQERLLSDLIAPTQTPVAERPKPAAPRPRSDRRNEPSLAFLNNVAINMALLTELSPLHSETSRKDEPYT